MFIFFPYLYPHYMSKKFITVYLGIKKWVTFEIKFCKTFLRVKDSGVVGSLWISRIPLLRMEYFVSGLYVRTVIFWHISFFFLRWHMICLNLWPRRVKPWEEEFSIYLNDITSILMSRYIWLICSEQEDSTNICIHYCWINLELIVGNWCTVDILSFRYWFYRI